MRRLLFMLWTDCKGCLGIVGSFMLTLFLSSVNEDMLFVRRRVLQQYQDLLGRLSKRFEFAALPYVRLNLFFERLLPRPGVDEVSDLDS